jgi:hypothetical protein
MRPSKHSINAKQKRASIQPSPHKEPLWLSAHAHGIKSLISKIVQEDKKSVFAVFCLKTGKNASLALIQV